MLDLKRDVDRWRNLKQTVLRCQDTGVPIKPRRRYIAIDLLLLVLPVLVAVSLPLLSGFLLFLKHNPSGKGAVAINYVSGGAICGGLLFLLFLVPLDNRYRRAYRLADARQIAKSGEVEKGSIYVGASFADPRLRPLGFFNWDYGFVSLDEGCLRFQGLEYSFWLPKSLVTSIEPSCSATGRPLVIIHWNSPEGSPEIVGLSIPDKLKLEEQTQATDKLLDYLRSWPSGEIQKLDNLPIRGSRYLFEEVAFQKPSLAAMAITFAPLSFIASCIVLYVWSLFPGNMHLLVSVATTAILATLIVGAMCSVTTQKLIGLIKSKNKA